MSREDDRSFKLDRGARSFTPIDLGLGEVPWIMIALVVFVAAAAGLGYVFDQLGQVLPANVRLVAIGFALGFLFGLRVGARRARLPAADPAPPSDRVKELARDPDRKIEAIRVYRAETGAGLAAAKEAVEAYIRSL